ncbi:MAG: 50S ribosomal protein L19 [Phycisphaerales bacterium]|nr:50S ribosomal protein L19 [Phycisphaerales bacterium]
MSQPSHSQQAILESLNQTALKTDLPRMDVGDTISVHCRIVEGDKERVQVYQGVVISRRGRGVNEMITVRRVVDEVGIERRFPINSPMVAKFEVTRHGDARRAKLYYLRERVGKSRRLRDRRRGIKNLEVATGNARPAPKPAGEGTPEPAAATA